MSWLCLMSSAPLPPADMRKLVCPAHAVLAGVKAVPGGNFYPGQASRAVSVRR